MSILGIISAMKILSPRQFVELFHLLFINQLSTKLDQRAYALKGGANMRFFFRSPSGPMEYGYAGSSQRRISGGSAL